MSVTTSSPWPPPDRSTWPAGFTPNRDGWVKWYKGKTRHVCAKGTPLHEVVERWVIKRRVIDGTDELPILTPRALTYRLVLSEFLADCEHRVHTGKPHPLEQRTLDNYVMELNAFGAFKVDGRAIADHAIDEITPAAFSAYAKKFGDWKASGFDSVVSRIGSLFRWAVEMEYLDRYRPGPMFQRPGKAAIRDNRIDLAKRFEPAEVAKLYRAASHTMRCWIGLGVGAGFINTDIAHLPRACIDLQTGVIDFRRRKRGKIRRVIPLPDAVVDDLKRYRRPEPADALLADRFFLTGSGRSYLACPSTISRLFRELMQTCGLPLGTGRNFTGLRTTFFNLAPRSAEYEIERKIIMGRAHGTIDLDHYLEDVGLDRLRHVVDHVWQQVSSEIEVQE